MVPQVAARRQARVGRLQPDIALWLGVSASAWIAACWLEASGAAHVLHHHTIFHSGQIVAGGLALLGVWQVMTVAMMLPGALPAVHRIGRGSGQLVFLAAYAAVWTGFALVAFVGDMGLHSAVHAWPLVAAHENLIPAAVLGAAALYQLSGWKGASLEACRRAAVTPPHLWDRRSLGMGRFDALAAGITYARHCLVSGWALMLIMFSAGVADLVWMAALALTVLTEKTMPSADPVRYSVAGVLAVLAAGTLVGGNVL